MKKRLAQGRPGTVQVDTIEGALIWRGWQKQSYLKASEGDKVNMERIGKEITYRWRRGSATVELVLMVQSSSRSH